jgi:hypothetical protein
MNQRLMVYRKVAAARTEAELQAELEAIRDRYGAPPASVLNLGEYGRIRILADRLGVDTIDREGRLVVIKFRAQAKIDPMRLVKVVGGWPGAVLVPPVSLKLDLEAPATPAPAPAPAPAGKAGARRRPGPQAGTGSASWWTARATAGEVTAGFSKDEILRKPDENPRAAGGLFTRLGGLLEALSG